MSPRARSVPAALGLSLLAPALLAAEGIHRFQHGGRATAQVGALTARADEPSALTYNPAGIARLDGLQLQGGLDFANPTDDYESPSGSHRADHTIQFPPALYLTWRPAGGGSLAYGIGFDTPAWYRLDWATALFPARFLTRTREVRLFEVHPVVAYEIDDHWSVGGGLRYLFGSLEYGFNFDGQIQSATGALVPFELEALAKADVDAFTFDLAVHYDANVWGFGAVYRGAADFEEGGGVDLRLRDIADPALADNALLAFDFDRADQSFELPRELRGGVWIAPYPELRLELDAALRDWSSLGDTDVTVSGASRPPIVRREPRDWDDTLSLRLAAEGDLSEQWSVGGGVAWEPSPVAGPIEPGFPRADAMVYALGGSYRLEAFTLDLGYSFHDFDERGATGQEVGIPELRSRYGARDQVWSVSARWEF